MFVSTCQQMDQQLLQTTLNITISLMAVNKTGYILQRVFQKIRLKMAEFNKGIYLTVKDIYQSNKGSLLRTLIYTIGHFLIAITVLMLISNVSFMIALTDAIVEPIANAVWYFALDKIWTAKYKK